MRLSLILLFCLTANLVLAQVVVDRHLPAAYNKVVNKMPDEYQRSIKKIEKAFSGIAIYTVYQIDTLNKQNLTKRHGWVTVSDIDTGIANKPTPVTDDQKTFIPTPAKAYLRNDSLLITVSDGNSFGSGVDFHIYHNSASISYELYLHRDTVLRLTLKKHKTDHMMLPVTLRSFKLSTAIFRPGETLFGEADVLTYPYYQDDSNFKTGHIKKQLHYKFVFKAIIASGK